MVEKMNPKLAEALAAALPGPRQQRTEQVLIALAPTEKAWLVALARVRGERPATLARTLILTALETLEGTEGNVTVEFEDGCHCDKRHDTVEFWALADGNRLRCLITAEAMLGFGPGTNTERFLRHRERIIDTARRLIRHGRVSDGEVRILSSTPLAESPAARTGR